MLKINFIKIDIIKIDFLFRFSGNQMLFGREIVMKKKPCFSSALMKIFPLKKKIFHYVECLFIEYYDDYINHISIIQWGPIQLLTPLHYHCLYTQCYANHVCMSMLYDNQKLKSFMIMMIKIYTNFQIWSSSLTSVHSSTSQTRE